jgi:hypothetical protein
VYEQQKGALSAMALLTKKLRKQFPPLYAQEHVTDPIVYAKFYFPAPNGWTWYATEFDGKDMFFGWVVGFEKEIGYFTLSELESIAVPSGTVIGTVEELESIQVIDFDFSGVQVLKVIRDETFTPMPLSEVKKLHP